MFNEWYARDCSRKVRSAFRAKAMRGEYLNSYAPFGYRKDPADKHHLIPDEHAPIVKRMFQMALEGKTSYYIAKVLAEEKVLTPRAYLMAQYGKYETDERRRHPYAWAKTSVEEILANPLYLGKLVYQKTMKKSYKDKEVVSAPEEERIVVENTHEALVDQSTFDTVQERLRVKQPATWANSDNIYRGLLFCGECGLRLVFTTRKDKRRSVGSFCCSKYRRYGGKECTCHYITVEQIKALLLEDIRRHASLADADAERYAEYLARLSDRGLDDSVESSKKELHRCRERLSELGTVMKRLYEDNVFGRIPDELFTEMSSDYQAESKSLKERSQELNERLAAFKRKSRDTKDFANLVKQYVDVTELTEELLHTLIERVAVHEKEVVDGEPVMRVEIYYRFIGKVGTSDGDGLIANVRWNPKTMRESGVMSAKERRKRLSK